MTWHEAAPPAEERLLAAPTTTRSRQTAASSLTRPAMLVAKPPEMAKSPKIYANANIQTKEE